MYIIKNKNSMNGFKDQIRKKKKKSDKIAEERIREPENGLEGDYLEDNTER